MQSATFNVNCRLAKSDDIPFIYESLKSVAEEQNMLNRYSQTRQTLQDALFSEKAFADCIIADLDGKPAGLLLFSVVNLNFNMFPSPGIYVHDTYVAPENRRKGVAKKLGEYLIKVGNERNCSRI